MIGGYLDSTTWYQSELVKNIKFILMMSFIKIGFNNSTKCLLCKNNSAAISVLGKSIEELIKI